MGDLSPHFSRVEFTCLCGCGFDTVDVKLIQLAEHVREHEGSFTPNSANRCVAHNSKIGGGERSQHLVSKAIDVPTNNPKALYDWLDEQYPNTLGLGLYSRFVHVDVRNKKARW